MTKKWLILDAALVTLGIIGLCLLMLEPEKKKQSADKNQPLITASEITFRHRDKKKEIISTIHAALSTYNEKKSQAALTNLSLTVIKNKDIIAQLTTESAVYETKLKILSVSKPLTGTALGGKITIQEAYYTTNNHMIMANKHIAFENPELTITATSGSVNLETHQIVLNNVFSEYRSEKS